MMPKKEYKRMYRKGGEKGLGRRGPEPAVRSI
jgi:hypothetical protein